MKFDLRQEYYSYPSLLHGIMHTYRVMYNVILLSQEHYISEQISKTAFCAAFIHDMARKHDDFCTKHGAWAVKEKLPLFVNDFIIYGLNEANIEAIETSVTFHSLPEELENTHPHYQVTALLKDADALDRIRIGADDLNPKYLRLSKSMELIENTKNNYYKTKNIICKNWNEFFQIVNSD